MAATPDAQGALRVAENCFTAGDYRRAEAVLGAELAADPHHPGLLTAYAQAMLGLADHVSAARHAHAALGAAPDNEYVMRIYARALEGLGRAPDALAITWRMVAAHPGSASARYDHARLLHHAGRPADAMGAVDEALRLNPAHVDAIVLRGDLFSTLRRPGPAEECYREALRLRPGDAIAMHNLAKLEYGRGRRWRAVRQFVDAATVDPSLGSVVIGNITVILMAVMRRASWLILMVGFAVMVTTNRQGDGGSAVVARIVAGVGAVLLVVTLVRLTREVPNPILKFILRQRQLMVVRSLQVVLAVVLGALTAAVGAVEVLSVTAAVLVFSVPVVAIVGRLTDDRLG